MTASERATDPADHPPSARATPVRSLAVYHFEGCPYCERVRDAERALGLALEWRDVERDPRHRRALHAARGRGTVPVLRIERQAGPDVWMPESADIIAFLRAHARGETPPLPEPEASLAARPRLAALALALIVIALVAVGVIAWRGWPAS